MPLSTRPIRKADGLEQFPRVVVAVPVEASLSVDAIAGSPDAACVYATPHGTTSRFRPVASMTSSRSTNSISSSLSSSSWSVLLCVRTLTT